MKKGGWGVGLERYEQNDIRQPDTYEFWLILYLRWRLEEMDGGVVTDGDGSERSN
jgi:hypothetical protein